MIDSPRHYPLVRLALLTLVTAFLLGFYLDAIWTDSGDMAHHYALVARLTEFWRLPAGGDPTLGEMNIYPQLSHRMAALAGGLFGSPLRGMQVITISSLIALWSSLILMLLSLPRRSALLAWACMALLLVVNRTGPHIDLFGGEIVGNFFYAQLVAQALAIGALYCCVYWEQRGAAAWTRDVFLFICIGVINFAHLMPGMELLAVLLAILALDCAEAWFRPQGGRRPGPLHLGACAALGMAALASVVLHPSFAAMRSIGMNDGDLRFSHIPSITALAILSAAVLMLSLGWLWRWLRLSSPDARRQFVAIKYLALYGVAIAALCLLQILALRLGASTAYAAKKYVFALDTIGLIELALLPVLWRMERAASAAASVRSVLARLHYYGAAPALIALAIYVSLPTSQLNRTGTMVALEQQIQTLRDAVINKQPGLHDYAIGLKGVTHSMNYLYTIGVLKTPRGGNALDAFEDKPFSDPGTVGSIITSEHNRRYDIAACRRHVTPAGLVVLDGACVLANMSLATSCQGTFDLTQEGTVNISMLTGFSRPESHGSWTVMRQASFSCGAETAIAAKTVAIDAMGFVPPGKIQHVQVRLNGVPAAQFEFDPAHARQTMIVPLAGGSGKTLQIELILPDAAAPKQLGLGEDQRTLGVSVRTITFR